MREVKEDAVQTSSSIALAGLPTGPTPKMRKDYISPNFGVKDIQTAKPKYTVYKGMKKKK